VSHTILFKLEAPVVGQQETGFWTDTTSGIERQAITSATTNAHDPG
jgi:hypothetical protein